MRKMSNVAEFVTCPGDRVHLHYNPVFDGKRVILQKSGESDIQKEIESYGRYTDLHYMLHRLSVGDVSVLTNRQPIYGDFSGLPDNPVDIINIIHSAESTFSALSLEDRATYNNDFRSWLAALLSGDLDGKDAVSVPAAAAQSEPVKEE